MIITVHVHVKDNLLHVNVPEAGMRLEVPAIVACRAAGRRIIAVGKTAEDMMLDSPMWSDDLEVEFLTPFDAHQFDAELVIALLRYYAGMAQDRIRAGGTALLLGRLRDRFVCNLWMTDYANLPATTRERFEQAVRALPKGKGLRFRQFFLNGQALLGKS